MIKNQETLQSLIAEAYGLSVQMMKTIEAQDGVYAVYTTEKQYALKKNPYPWPEFHFIAQALEHVCRRGVSMGKPGVAGSTRESIDSLAR